MILLHVKTPGEALETILSSFNGRFTATERISAVLSLGRVAGEDIRANEYVPDFSRSTVDGYAVKARDTFGSSDGIPALLTLSGEVKMGAAAPGALRGGTCMAVPTGGDLPEGADAVVMLEYTEDYGDGTIGVTKPAAPGENVIFRGDDTKPGDILLPRGHVITPHDIGALAASGNTEVAVSARPRVGIISTGDELVPSGEKPEKGQVRDVNTPMLAAMIASSGATPVPYGILRDDESALLETLSAAAAACDAVLISGGSSVGMKDMTVRVIESLGSILFHGIAMKPGKPTILGSIGGRPVYGLPGHPVAAYFVTELFVRPLLAQLTGRTERRYPIPARLSEAVPSNHGRAEYLGVVLEEGGEWTAARPVRGKSGLITSLQGTDGYICVPRDCEGLPRGAQVSVTLWNR